MARRDDLGAQHERFLRSHAELLGIEWRKYRRRQSRRGLLGRLDARGLGRDLEAYGRLLEQEPDEREALVGAMHVTVSRFYRDPEVWRGLEGEGLPWLAAKRPPGSTLRAWSVGCASGEEPYSLAIAWSRIDPGLREGRSLSILATDLDPVVLGRAREGVYDRGSLRDLPPAAREHAFDALPDGRFRLRSAWRVGVEFRQADLLVDEPPENVDLVLCRYLMLTYYRGARLEAALDRLERATAPAGLIVVGRREPLPPEALGRLRRWRSQVPCVYGFASS